MIMFNKHNHNIIIIIHKMENVENLDEIITFIHKIILGFNSLKDGLYDKIYAKLSENEFTNMDYDVKDIKNYSVQELKVSGKTIVCKLNVTAVCNNPRIGKRIMIDNFEVKNKKIIYRNGRIQAIVKQENHPEKSSYIIRIDAIKNVNKNILCIGTIVQ